MVMFKYHQERNQNKQQIKLSTSCVCSMLLFCSGCFFVAVLSREDKMLFVAIACLALGYSLLAARNDRLAYDNTGITLYTLLGKCFHKPWSDILRVEICEEPLISKQLFIGRIMRITCTEKKGLTTVIYRFPYRYYVGIDDFLSFYLVRSSEATEHCDENDC